MVSHSNSDQFNNLYTLAADLEERSLLNVQDVRIFMCACCRLIWDKLPPLAQEALGVAEAYLKRQTTDELLVEARSKLWVFLGSECLNLASPTVNAVRAVICCLYPDGDSAMKEEQLYDLLVFAVQRRSAVRRHETQQLELFREIFKEPGPARV